MEDKRAKEGGEASRSGERDDVLFLVCQGAEGSTRVNHGHKRIAIQESEHIRLGREQKRGGQRH